MPRKKSKTQSDVQVANPPKENHGVSLQTQLKEFLPKYFWGAEYDMDRQVWHLYQNSQIGSVPDGRTFHVAHQQLSVIDVMKVMKKWQYFSGQGLEFWCKTLADKLKSEAILINGDGEGPTTVNLDKRQLDNVFGIAESTLKYELNKLSDDFVFTINFRYVRFENELTVLIAISPDEEKYDLSAIQIHNEPLAVDILEKVTISRYVNSADEVTAVIREIVNAKMEFIKSWIESHSRSNPACLDWGRFKVLN